MLAITAFVLILALLDKTQRTIAKLAFATVKQSPNRDNEPLVPSVCVITVVCELWGNTNLAIAGLIYLLCQYISNIWRTQEIFCTLDQKAKSNEPSYISSVNPATQSGWANDPRLLKHIPPFLSTRVLTTMTLVEVLVVLFVAYFLPSYTAHALIFTVLGHYITDALDGAVGRYRKEGYVLWGYYVDHCFDTLYECGTMTALWLVSNNYGLVAIIAMAFTVHLFHEKEYHMYEHKLATQYTNVMGSFPLHYIEWASICALMCIIWFQIPWDTTVMVVCVLTLLSTGNLCWWNITHRIEETK